MNFKIYLPSPALQEYIKYYWVMESDGLENHIPALVYPEGNPELFFHYGDVFEYTYEDGLVRRQPLSFLCCQKTMTASVCTTGKTGMIAVTFKPFGASAFFRFDLNKHRNEKIDLCDILGDKQKEASERIAEAITAHERINIIESLLLNLLSVNIREMEIVKQGIVIINNSPGRISIGQAAEKTCLSYRQFERIFLHNIGISPREYLKIKKVNYAIGLLKSRKNVNLTEIALDSGYYDQAHFNNSFKTVVSLTPSDFYKQLRA